MERLCVYCKEVLGDEWTRKGQKYCSVACKMSQAYRDKYKVYYDAKYQRLKKEWEKSVNGKRAGIPIRTWLKMPKDWR